MKKRYFEEVKELAKKLNTDLVSGLSKREARIRLEKEKKADRGRRSLFVPKKSGIFRCIIFFYRSPFALLMMLLTLLSVLFGSYEVGVPVLMITVFGSVVLGISYAKSKKDSDRMLLYSVPMTKVIRSGGVYRTDSKNIVVGDIIYFEAGDCIPCDARLIVSDGLSVGEYVKENGEVKRIVSYKDAQSGEGGGSYLDNTVYAGSQVLTGNGRAIAVRTGSNVKTAEVIGDSILGRKNADCKGIGLVIAGFGRLNVALVICALLMSVAGMFTVRDKGMIDVFMIALSSVNLLMSGFVPMVCRIICSEAITRVKKTDKKNESAIIKNTRAIDALCEATDLFLLGRVGITDGKKHIGRIFVGGADTGRDSCPPDIPKALAEYIYCYIKCLNESSEGYFDTLTCEGYEDALESFVISSGYDTAKIDLTLKSLYYLCNKQEKDNFACLEFDDRDLKICITFDMTAVFECTKMRSGKNVSVVTLSERNKINSFVDSINEIGQNPVAIISDSEEGRVLEGIIGFEEAVVTDLPETIGKFQKSGINVRLLLDGEDRENVNYALKSGIAASLDDIAMALDFARRGAEITDDFGKYSVYMGFDIKEYVRLAEHIKDGGGCAVSYGVCNKYNPVMNASDLSVTCDYMAYDSQSYAAMAYEKPEPEGRETSKIASHSTRVNAGVIVKRSGGLKGLINARSAAREAYLNLSYAMLYIVCSFALRLAFAIISLISGILMLDSVRIMSLWVVLDLTAVMFFSSNRANRSILEGKRRIDCTYPQTVLGKNKKRLYALVCGVPLYLGAVLAFRISGFIPDYYSVGAATYIALVLCGISEILIISGKYCSAVLSRRFLRTLTSALLPIFMTLLCLISPILLNAVGFLTMDLRALVLVPVYILIYTVSVIISDNVRPLPKLKKKHKN